MNKNVLFCGWQSFNNKRYYKNLDWIFTRCSIQKPTKLAHIDAISRKKYNSFQIATFRYKKPLEKQVNSYISQIPIKLARTFQQENLQNSPYRHIDTRRKHIALWLTAIQHPAELAARCCSDPGEVVADGLRTTFCGSEASWQYPPRPWLLKALPE